MKEQKVIYVTVDEDGNTKKDRWGSVKEKTKSAARVVKQKASDSLMFVRDHAFDIVMVAGAVTAASNCVFKIRRNAQLLSERNSQSDILHDRTYYDPRSGMHFELKRGLKNSERIEILERVRNGEKVETVLDDLNLLKK